MNPEELERFRICLLQQLRTVGDGSLPVPTLATGARLAGFADANDATVRAALVYLADPDSKRLVAPVAKLLSPENKRWRITAAGIDFLAEAGL